MNVAHKLLLQGVAARLGVDWSVAKKWAPLAKDGKSLHACGFIWHGSWNHLSLGNWDNVLDFDG